MPAHNHLPVIPTAVEKLLLDPEHIPLSPPVERYARSDAGMNKEIVAFDVRRSQLAQGIEVCLRQDAQKLPLTLAGFLRRVQLGGSTP